MKTCSKCNNKKPAKEFHKDSRSKDGLNSRCKDCRKEYTRRYNTDNRDRINARQRAYSKRFEVRERHLEWCHDYYQKNKQSLDQKRKKWAEDNIDLVRSYKRKQQRRYMADPLKAEKHRIRSRLAVSISKKGFSKKKKTEHMLGCSWEFFLKHIEDNFLEGMSWENRSEWHIDHIIPLSSARKIEDLNRLANYQNTRPLWAFDNLSKGAKSDHSSN